ncbi:MAG TPA: hypothetical protein VN823_10890 [Stellaceae bacterium]|nr:hypothetical protein [Stellaceae bacterium]
MKRATKNLPPLQVGQAYEATDFERFDFVRYPQPGSKAILRLHLKNGTTVDLPTTDDELRRLALTLCAAFAEAVIADLRQRGWI